MKSNGFGSMEQTIIIRVPEEQESALTSMLDCVPVHQAGEPGRAFLSWNRWTTRTGDDEDVVFELFMLIGGPCEELAWEVDWSLSEYRIPTR